MNQFDPLGIYQSSDRQDLVERIENDETGDLYIDCRCQKKQNDNIGREDTKQDNARQGKARQGNTR